MCNLLALQPDSFHTPFQETVSHRNSCFSPKALPPNTVYHPYMLVSFCPRCFASRLQSSLLASPPILTSPRRLLLQDIIPAPLQVLRERLSFLITYKNSSFALIVQGFQYTCLTKTFLPPYNLYYLSYNPLLRLKQCACHVIAFLVPLLLTTKMTLWWQ